jgi:hypothetical protein
MSCCPIKDRRRAEEPNGYPGGKCGAVRSRCRHAQGLPHDRFSRRGRRACCKPRDPDNDCGFPEAIELAEKRGDVVWGVEGTGSYGRGLAEALVARQYLVYEVPGSFTKRHRSLGVGGRSRMRSMPERKLRLFYARLACCRDSKNRTSKKLKLTRFTGTPCTAAC